jgi:phosphate:Na+ symporter
MPSGSLDLDGAALGAIAANMAGGLALQLMGISSVSQALQQALGPRLPAVIRASCSHPVTAFATGAVATAAMTSATATSMMVVEFVESGAMVFGDSLPVALGINVGSTFAPLISRVFPLARFGLAILGLAYFARVILTQKPSKPSASAPGFRPATAAPAAPAPSASEQAPESRDDPADEQATVGGAGIPWYWIASAIMGLGQLFLGMHLLSQAVAPLKKHEPFRDLLLKLADTPWQGVLCGAVLTLVVQSSTAAIAIAAELSATGTMPAQLAVAIAVGSNVGTCATTLAAAQGKSKAAMRFALAYLLFKVAGALAVLPLFDSFVMLCTSAATAAGAHAGPQAAAMACSWSHTLFNVALAVVFLPFSRALVTPICWLVGPPREPPGSGPPATSIKPKPE